ncbi:MAG: hypothetical protein QOF51_4141 [Chloroflexota bacterium]|jgi:hypothetical protein|nr:hypothetical protein [Chloroflexota bacterium]
MNPAHLKQGMQCTTSDGSLVEVREVLPDNVFIRVKYLDSLDNPEIPVGSEGQVPYEELIAEYQGTHAEGLT